MSTFPMIVSGAVEGIVDEAVLRRLLQELDATPGPIHIAGGKSRLRDRISGYNQAARHQPWVVLVDLNHEAVCAPELRVSWFPAVNEFMCFRVAVRETEAWLLADQQRIAQFLDVSVRRIPSLPDELDDPKAAVVDLARRSGRRDIREDMVPRPRSRRSEGPAYASRLIEFAQQLWRPTVAESRSDSLRRCRQALLGLVRGRSPP